MTSLTRDREEHLAQLLVGHGRCTVLLGLLIGLLAIYPYFQTWHLGRLVLQVLQLSTILIGLYAVAGRGVSFKLGALLAATVLGLYVHRIVTGGADPPLRPAIRPEHRLLPDRYRAAPGLPAAQGARARHSGHSDQPRRHARSRQPLGGAVGDAGVERRAREGPAAMGWPRDGLSGAAQRDRAR